MCVGFALFGFDFRKVGVGIKSSGWNLVSLQSYYTSPRQCEEAAEGMS